MHAESMRHYDKVERVAQQLRRRRPGQPISMHKRAVSHVVPKRKDLRHSDAKIDVRDLDEIIEIDAAGRTCTAEPGVTFTDLVRATLSYGLVPFVVPELRTITIGGAVAGCSIESMSFACGGFHDTCLEYELITAKGDVLRCTPDNEHALIFQMMHGSFGTLGILTQLKFKLTPAKKFVRLEHHTHSTLESFKAEIQEHYTKKDIDFMDGFVHAPNKYVLSVGWFVNEAPYTNRYDWMKVYYKSTEVRTEDYLETDQYFFRYENGVTNPTFKNPLRRLLFGKFFHTTELLRVAERWPWLIPAKKPQLTIDLFLPFSKLGTFLDWYRTDFAYYPLWVVPYKLMRKYEWLADEYASRIEDELFIDLAIYGAKQREDRNDYRVLEEAIARADGIKTLISYNYYSEDEFWRLWNKPNYDAVKRITDPENVFRNLYEKTCKAAHGE